MPSMGKASSGAPRSKALECPSCRRQFNADDVAVAGRGRGSRCTRCGARLVVAGRLLEIEVRRQLYGSTRSPVARVMSAEEARR